MESPSEDGSFVWTDASNSTSSEDMVTNMAGGNSGGEESEYDKSYKKKLHKELFTNENGHEREVRTKKRKRERYTSGSEHSETSRKKIKVEPESDIDFARVETKHTALNGYDEHLLDEKVKREQEFLLPTDKIKKKKRKKSICNDNVDIYIKSDTELNRTEEKPSNESNTEDSSSRVDCEGSNHQDEYNVTKKKKKKKSEKIEESQVMETDDNRNQNTVQQQTSMSNESGKKDTAQKEKQSVNVSRDLTMDSTTADLDISEISKISNVNITQDESLTVQNNKTRRRLSERIQFEDDVVVDSEQSRDMSARKPSNKLRRFAEKHKLRACAVRDLTEFTIGECDEVWVVTCPGDVDVAAFAGRTLELGTRCKVKLDGAAHEGGAEPAAAGAAAALLAGARVRRVPLAGRLALHRRVPRAPAAPPHAAAPAARRPLPDTKLRHPLLGAHYKKALKLPPAVRQRLQPAPPPVAVALAPPRRHKSEAPSAPAPSKKKAKRKKHDLEAPETWESERAIEESLFDF